MKYTIPYGKRLNYPTLTLHREEKQTTAITCQGITFNLDDKNRLDLSSALTFSEEILRAALLIKSTPSVDINKVIIDIIN